MRKEKSTKKNFADNFQLLSTILEKRSDKAWQKRIFSNTINLFINALESETKLNLKLAPPPLSFPILGQPSFTLSEFKSLPNYLAEGFRGIQYFLEKLVTYTTSPTMSAIQQAITWWVDTARTYHKFLNNNDHELKKLFLKYVKFISQPEAAALTVSDIGKIKFNICKHEISQEAQQLIRYFFIAGALKQQVENPYPLPSDDDAIVENYAKWQRSLSKQLFLISDHTSADSKKEPSSASSSSTSSSSVAQQLPEPAVLTTSTDSSSLLPTLSLPQSTPATSIETTTSLGSSSASSSSSSSPSSVAQTLPESIVSTTSVGSTSSLPTLSLTQPTHAAQLTQSSEVASIIETASSSGSSSASSSSSSSYSSVTQKLTKSAVPTTTNLSRSPLPPSQDIKVIHPKSSAPSKGTALWDMFKAPNPNLIFPKLEELFKLAGENKNMMSWHVKEAMEKTQSEIVNHLQKCFGKFMDARPKGANNQHILLLNKKTNSGEKNYFLGKFITGLQFFILNFSHFKLNPAPSLDTVIALAKWIFACIEANKQYGADEKFIAAFNQYLYYNTSSSSDEEIQKEYQDLTGDEHATFVFDYESTLAQKTRNLTNNNSAVRTFACQLSMVEDDLYELDRVLERKITEARIEAYKDSIDHEEDITYQICELFGETSTKTQVKVDAISRPASLPVVVKDPKVAQQITSQYKSPKTDPALGPVSTLRQ
jgi:hypothetical protein